MKNWAIVAILLTLMTTKTLANTEYKPDANAPRKNVPEIFKWDVSAILRSDSDWESAYKTISQGLDRLTKFKGKLANVDQLANCMKEYVALHKLFDKASLYSNLKNVEDENVETYQKMHQRQISLANAFNEKALFMREEILKLDNISDPKLAEYKDYIFEMRRRKHSVLGLEAEKVLSLAGDNLWAEVDLNELPSDVETIFKAVLRDIQLPKIKDENGKEVQLALSNYSKYRSSKDRRVRSETVNAFFSALKKYQNIFASTLAGEFKRDVFLAKARNYPRAVDAYLDRENISPKVIDNLIDTIHKNLKPLHRYVELRKKILKLPDLHIYDLYTPLVPSAEKDIPYDEAVKSMTEALRPLGEDYVKVLSKAIKPESRWVDVYPNKGKESGAFSTSIWGLHPFVKLNYMNSIDDASTLAHEFGHAMHSHLNSNAQPYLASGYSTLTAEIASTLNEQLFSKYMLEKYKDDEKMKLYLLGEQVESIRTTVYRQTLFAEFEKKLHEFVEQSTPLTAELFNKTYKDLLKLYYGPNFVIGENDDIEWAYIPHFYWKFYVYSYAAGLSSGIAMSDNILKEGEAGRTRYLEMLKSPNTARSVDIIKKAGVDLTKPTSIEAAAKLLNHSIDEMEGILDRSAGL